MKDDIQETRKKLQELKDMHFTGFLDDAQYAEHSARLERKLIDAVMNEAMAAETVGAIEPATQPAEQPVVTAPRPEEAPIKPPRRAPAARLSRWGMAAMMIVVAAGLGLVATYGWKAARGPASSDARDAAIPGATAAERQAMNPEQLAAAANKLGERLKARPNDADGWVTLARINTALSRYPEAASAYEKAVALRDTDASLFADFAEARAVTNNGNLSGEPTELIQRALKLEPTHIKALSLAATAAFDRKDYTSAIAYWDKIIEIAPANEPMLAKARSSVAEARQLALGAPASTAGVLTSAASSSDIRGTVTLAPELAQRASPSDTLFVYARAVDGPPVPLAVIRKQVKDLPLDFKLDDSMSMWPSAKVSTSAQVIVTARVSKSGEGQPQNGDLQGQSLPVAAGVSGVRIEIGTVVRK